MLGRPAILLLLAIAAPPAKAVCQGTGNGQQLAAAEVLADLSSSEPGRVSKARSTIASAFIRIQGPDGPLKLDSLVQGLESIALRIDTGERVVAEAVTLLAIAGGRDAMIPRPGILKRLQRVYMAKSSGVVRATILGQAVYLAEQEEAIDFVRESIAATDDDIVATAGIRSLSASGGQLGRDALRVLHESTPPKSEAARRLLAILAKSDFVMHRDTTRAVR